ncbi:MAG TPA: hypothetical protein PKW95_22845 [bacterium]|nr:hypothetical protein [bacterium]
MKPLEMTELNRTKRSRLLLLFGALLAALLAAEIVSYVLLSIGWDGTPERSEIRARLHGEREADQFTLPGEGERLATNVLHPYFGFAVDRSIDPNVNRYGFFAPEPPLGDDPAVLDIALMGGSLVQYFRFAQGSLIARLREEMPGEKRIIRIHNLALKGGKQPQQVMILAYLLAQGHSFDMVINLDGFNEVTLPLAENRPYGVALSFPRNWRTQARRGYDPHMTRDVGRLQALYEKRARWRHRFERWGLPYLSSSLLVWHRLDRWYQGKIDEAQGDLLENLAGQEQSFQVSGPAKQYENDQAALKAAITKWQNGSRQLARLCRANGIKYLHFLQPNQYYADSKPLSAEEKQKAYNLEFPYAPLAARAYPLLAEAGRTLAAEGIDFHDFTQVFADHPETIYTDICCHVNVAGNEILAANLAKYIAAALR